MKAIQERITKILARLDTSGAEQALVLRSLESELRAARLAFVDIARVLEQVHEIEKRTQKTLHEISEIVLKIWPACKPGWAGLSTAEKFAFGREMASNSLLSDAERHRLIEITERLCAVPGNQMPPDDIEFLDKRPLA